MNKQRRTLILSVLLGAAGLVQPYSVLALDSNRQPRFLPEERRAIEEYYRPSKKAKNKGLPPGLAKRNGNLPPGLQKKLERDGQLPPGLQKRLEPLPVDLNRQLPRLPEHWERVVVERDIILIDRRSNRILDIIEDVIDIVKGR